MSFTVRNINNLDQAGKNFGEGLGEGYMQGSDERTIRKAVESLPPNASYRDILNAVSGANVYNPKTKQQVLENYAKAHELDLKEQYYNSKRNKEIDKEQKKIELDLAEAEFLETIKDMDLSPIDVYHKGRGANLPIESSKRVSDLYRLNKAEDRRIKKDLTDVYDYEIKRLDNLIKESTRTADRRDLIAKRDDLQSARQRDLARWDKGERNFAPEIHGNPTPEIMPKPKFDKNNPDHQAIARTLYDAIPEGTAQEKKEKVREALRQEFDL